MHLLKTGFILSSLILGGQDAQARNVTQPQPIPQHSTQMGTQWITTPQACSYCRTQAPGYPVQWVLIMNPHHIGQPNAHARCAPILGS